MRTNKIIVLQGCPCSGKSTYAQNVKDERIVVVNLDTIRTELSGGKFTFDHEEEALAKEEQMVRDAIAANCDVMIDATNLNPKKIEKWKALAQELECPIEFKMFYIPFEEAMKRSKARKEAGGLYINKNIMRGFYRRYFPDRYKDELTDKRVIREPDHSLPNCVICDLDATLALHRGREPFDWSLIYSDKIDTRLRDVLNLFMAQDVQVFFVTGRNDSAREATENWLKYLPHELSTPWKLFTRKDNDFSHSDDYKEKIYHEHIEGKYNVLCVFEDSNKCVTRWRELGLLTCQVANNDY